MMKIVSGNPAAVDLPRCVLLRSSESTPPGESPLRNQPFTRAAAAAWAIHRCSSIHAIALSRCQL
jgi:hypothetical protein